MVGPCAATCWCKAIRRFQSSRWVLRAFGRKTVVRITPDGTEQVKATYNSGQANMELTTKANVLTYEQRSVPSDAVICARCR